MADTNDDIGGTIYFYLAQNDYGYFSNFSRHTVFLKGKKWPTSEHYFQAQKFSGTPLEEKIRLAAKPGEAANMGRSRAHPLRKDWEDIKEDVMKEVLKAKFTQRKELTQALLATKGKTLIEHTEKDSYWGDGGDGSGKNRLGVLLMEVRDELLGETKSKSNVNQTQNNNNNNNNNNTNKIEEAKESKVEEKEIKETEEGEKEGEGEEGEEGGKEIEGVEPNINRYYKAGVVVEPKKNSSENIKKHKKKVVSGSGKTKTKGAVYRDADGSSKLEKNSSVKGAVTVVGDGTVFSEKALPPLAKSVVNKYQKQRKYHPTEEDFEEEEDYTPVPKRDGNNNLISEFVDKQIVYNQDEIEDAEALQLAMVASIQEKEEADKRKKEFEKKLQKEKEINESVEAAKANIELLTSVKNLKDADIDILVSVQQTCEILKERLRRYVTEMTESGDIDMLPSVMEQVDKLNDLC